MQAGASPCALVCMLVEDKERTRSHGIPLPVIRAQADALGLPLIVRHASWEEYEREFVSALVEARSLGAELAVYGDLQGDEHLRWETMVSRRAGLEPWLPIFGRAWSLLLADLEQAGVRATVVAVISSMLGCRFIGRELTPAFCAEVEHLGLDAFGENGEYHTLVTDCVLFSSAIDVALTARCLGDGPWFAGFSRQPG